MTLELPFTECARRWGYLYWNKRIDEKVLSFFGKSKTVEIWWDNSFLGTKRVDWRYRRISIGYRFTRAVSDSVKQFRISPRKDGSFRVVCK